MSTQSVAELLEMFQNGEQRYDRDAYFKEAVTALQLGVGPIAILDRVLKEHVILMHLHNEAINKNRVAVAEVQRLSDDVASYKDALELSRQSRKL